MQANQVEYPSEIFIEINGDEHREGRITLNIINGAFCAEIDIVQKESRKIWKHIDMIFNLEDEKEATHRAVQKLSEYLQNPY